MVLKLKHLHVLGRNGVRRDLEAILDFDNRGPRSHTEQQNEMTSLCFCTMSSAKRGSSVFPSCVGIVENGCGQFEPKMRCVTPKRGPSTRGLNSFDFPIFHTHMVMAGPAFFGAQQFGASPWRNGVLRVWAGHFCTRPWRNGVLRVWAGHFLHTSLVKRGSSVFPSCAGIVENGCGQLEPKMRRVTPQTGS